MSLDMSNKTHKDNEEVLDQEAQDNQETDNENVITDIEPDEVDVEDDSVNSELDQLKDQLLRIQAEMVNVRRRSEEEVVKARKFAVESFAKELLGVRDSLQLAADTEIEAEDSDAVKAMHEGLGVTTKQLDSVFSKFSIVEIAPEAGDKLDPNLHQAMTMIPSEDIEPGCICSVLQKGYQLNERLLRPAMVVVAKK